MTQPFKMPFPPFPLIEYAHNREQLEEDAHRRLENKQRCGVKSQKHSEHSELRIHLLGVIGEFSIADYFGTDYDHSLYVGNDGYCGDVPLPDGQKIDCKMRSKQGWDWALEGADCETKLKAPFLGLVWPAKKGYAYIVGYMTREEFLKEKETMDFGYGRRWVARWQKFHHMGHLYKEVMANASAADRQAA